MNAFGAAAGDLNGDGRLDVLFAWSGRISVSYINQGLVGGKPSFTRKCLTTDCNNLSERRSCRDVKLGDLDGDGDLDVFFANNGKNRYGLNDGTGFFTMQDLPNDDSAGSLGVTLADFDGDGDLDAFVANEDVLNRLYENKGTSSGTWQGFKDPAALALSSGTDTATATSSSVISADFNGDGKPDLLVGNDGTANRLFLNNRGSDQIVKFSEGTITSNNLSKTLSLLSGDLDGDGDLDVVILNDGQNDGQNNGQNEILTNNGSGTLTREAMIVGSTADSQSNISQSGALEDLDGDGDLDLVIGNHDKVDRILYNDGDGTFTEAGVNAAGGFPTGTAVSDTEAVLIGEF